MDRSNIQETSDLSSRLEDEFACLVGSTSHGVWYIDSGALAHMTGAREYISSYKEEQMDFHITMGNITKCTPVGRGTIAFQMEVGIKIQGTNFLHVPGLKINLISVSQLWDKGYDVYFIGKKVNVKHPRWKKKKKIGLRSNKLYRLQLKSPMALIGNNCNGEKERNKLWHK